MKTVAFIPIKLNNERMPGKNIVRFSDGKPLIFFVQKSMVELKKQGIIDEIYVYCSSDEVRRYLLPEVDFLKRPDFLDQKEVVGKMIYDQFVKTIEADIYVLAHATSPFVTIEHIRMCVESVKSGNYDSAFCGKKIQSFLWMNSQPLNFDKDNPPRTQDLIPIFSEISTPYVFAKKTYLAYGSRTGVNPFIVTDCSEIESIDIDYPDDFELADAVYSSGLLAELYI